ASQSVAISAWITLMYISRHGGCNKRQVPFVCTEPPIFYLWRGACRFRAPPTFLKLVKGLRPNPTRTSTSILWNRRHLGYLQPTRPDIIPRHKSGKARSPWIAALGNGQHLDGRVATPWRDERSWTASRNTLIPSASPRASASA